MASNPTMTHTFVNGTPADASQVNANFTVLTAWIAANAMQIDGSVAFTGIPSGPATDPTTANQLVRKQYVDQRLARCLLSKSTTVTTSAVALSAMTEDEDLVGLYGGGASVVIPAGQAGLYIAQIEGTSAAGLSIYPGTGAKPLAAWVYVNGVQNGLGCSWDGPSATSQEFATGAFWLETGETVAIWVQARTAPDAALTHAFKLRVMRVG